MTWQLVFPEHMIKDEQGRSCQCLLRPSLGSYTVISAMHYWWQRSALFSGERTTQRHEFQEAKLTGAFMEANYYRNPPLKDGTAAGEICMCFVLLEYISNIHTVWEAENRSPTGLRHKMAKLGVGKTIDNLDGESQMQAEIPDANPHLSINSAQIYSRPLDSAGTGCLPSHPPAC